MRAKLYPLRKGFGERPLWSVDIDLMTESQVS